MWDKKRHQDCDGSFENMHGGILRQTLAKAGLSLTVSACGSVTLHVIIKHKPHSSFVAKLI